MSYLLASGTVVAMVAGSLGLGAALLKALGILARLERLEAAAWSFVVGFGAIGWATCFIGIAGYIDAPLLWAMLCLCLPGLYFLRDGERSGHGGIHLNIFTWFLLFAAAFLMAGDLAEAFSPPADADSLAYHFALPKQFLAAGRVYFVPRAVDGAVPLLTQMLNMLALKLGGETAMTLWAAVTGWWLGLLTFVTARRYMEVNWAFCVALLICSTPAMLYSGGSGHVEPRLALFVTVGALAMVRGIGERALNFITLAGLLAGFCAASKFTGVALAAAIAVPLLLWWRSPKAAAVYSLFALVAGCQWYGWNWWHTGDPIFPALFLPLHLSDGPYWTAEQDAIFRSVYLITERPFPSTVFGLLSFPFWVTLAPVEAVEAGRTGLGPYGWIILPFALAGVWHWRSRLKDHPLAMLMVMAVVFYVLWFLGGSQRVRHFLPILPILMICATAAALRWSRKFSVYRPLVAASLIIVAIQMGGQAIFSLSYFRYIFTNEDRTAFLNRTVANFGFVAPILAEMTSTDRVLVGIRQLIYFFDQSAFFYHALDQSQVVDRNAAANPIRFLQGLHDQNITLLLVPSPIGTPTVTNDLVAAVDALVRHGCAAPVKSLTSNSILSRTLNTNVIETPAVLYRISAERCDIKVSDELQHTLDHSSLL